MYACKLYNDMFEKFCHLMVIDYTYRVFLLFSFRLSLFSFSSASSGFVVNNEGHDENIISPCVAIFHMAFM